TSTAVPTTVTFNGSASTDPDNDDLDYHWNFGDGSPVQVTEEPVTTHTYGEGAFTAHLRVQDDAHMSVEATHVIEVGHPPAPTILTPSTTATFAINDMVNLSASASDPNETLDGSHFSWTVIRHHNNTHTHPFLGPLPGKTLSFHYPEPEDLDAAKDSKLEAILTVTDSTGIQRTVSRDLMPKKVQITIQDNRSTPLRLFANDLMYMGQGTFSSWPGYRIQLHAPSPQQFSDRYYRFDSWSDGKAQTHDIITGTANATYTANFTRVDGQAPAPPPPPPAPEIKGVQAIGRTPTGLGWWTAEADSEIKTFGNAVDYGDVSHIRLNKPVVGIAPTPSGKGYWMVATDGGVFSFGDADFWGSTGNVKLNQPVVGMASTPTGKGYYLVAADGGIFTFGDAVFKGSTGNVILKKPVVGMDVTPSGQGYWLVAADGGIFTFGNAPFKGTMANEFLAKPVVAMDSTP
ncbi:MAG: PKD domain-containing protein, partial [Acidimicrobiia bacterium]